MLCINYRDFPPATLSFDPIGSTWFYMEKRGSRSQLRKIRNRNLKKKKSLVWFRASYLYRKFTFRCWLARRSKLSPGWLMGIFLRGPLRRKSSEYLSFINRVFLSITKHSKCTLFIEKYISLSKKTMNEHITVW